MFTEKGMGMGWSEGGKKGEEGEDEVTSDAYACTQTTHMHMHALTRKYMHFCMRTQTYVHTH